MEVIKFSEEYIDEVFSIQRAAYKLLFDKYQDVETNPYTETKEKGNCHLYEKLGYSRVGEPKAINDKLTLVDYKKEIK